MLKNTMRWCMPEKKKAHLAKESAYIVIGPQHNELSSQ